MAVDSHSHLYLLSARDGVESWEVVGEKPPGITDRFKSGRELECRNADCRSLV